MAKAILFDLDGVIIDTERGVWRYSSVALMESYGKKHDEQQVKHLLMGCKFEEGTKFFMTFMAFQIHSNSF